MSITNSEFRENSAISSIGGVISLVKVQSTIFEYNTYESNFAFVTGGAVSADADCESLAINRYKHLFFKFNYAINLFRM